MRVIILGEKKLREDLARLEKAAPGAARKAVHLTALMVESDAKRFCPVDTGRLRSSILTDMWRTVAVAEVGTNVHYGPYVEFGTSRMHAQPFLTPAAQKNARTLAQEVAKAMRSLT